MSLEKILNKILEEAQREAEQIVLESRQKADTIRRDAKKQGGILAKTLLEQAERQGNLEASRLVTQARLEQKIKGLECKKDLIEEVLDKTFREQKGEKIGLKRKIILKDGEQEEFVGQGELKEELRSRLEKNIAEVLKI